MAIKRTSSIDRSTSLPIGSSFTSQSQIAQAAIEQDIADELHGNREMDNDDDIENTLSPTISRQEYSGHSLTGSYHRPNYFASGVNKPPFSVAASLPERNYLTEREEAEAIAEERSLLRDNSIIPPKHPRARRDSSRSNITANRIRDRISPAIPRIASHQELNDEEHAIDERPAAETSALLGDGGDPAQPYGGCDDETVTQKWEEAVADGKISTTWQREAKVIARYSRPLILTFLLQWSFTQASVVTVGHIGKKELGAVSLGSMTAGITGYAVYQGLATSLDTLCAQAYGSGHKTLVGLQMQRMALFLWAITIPIAIVWASGTQILTAIIPDAEVAALAGRYLKVLIAGAPGYAAFESGKRFVQAQGMFSVNMYCLLICAPLNALMHYLFVFVSCLISFDQRIKLLRGASS
jgi:hypothetical protein